MQRKDMINYLILGTAACTQWSHAELIDRVLRLAEGKMIPRTFYDSEEDNYMTVESVIDCGNLSGRFQWEKPNAE